MALLIGLLLAVFVLPFPWNVVIVVGAAGVEVLEITWGLRLARRRPRVGRETLVGRRARVLTPLVPTGQVMLDGERWQARASGGQAPPRDEGGVLAIDGPTPTGTPQPPPRAAPPPARPGRPPAPGPGPPPPGARPHAGGRGRPRMGIWRGRLARLSAHDEQAAVEALEQAGYGMFWLGEGVGTREPLAHAALLLAWTREALVG